MPEQLTTCMSYIGKHPDPVQACRCTTPSSTEGRLPKSKENVIIQYWNILICYVCINEAIISQRTKEFLFAFLTVKPNCIPRSTHILGLHRHRHRATFATTKVIPTQRIVSVTDKRILISSVGTIAGGSSVAIGQNRVVRAWILSCQSFMQTSTLRSTGSKLKLHLQKLPSWCYVI